ncbi:uncharacterized protein DS421_18g625290 [Arachis hypogaea]|nr:uncharacterized protein DS421_18g625280 [Arachis hypogaea]QHN97190.1 uncharacterized protein DS421_18g625280 [Arachis hypogaea]QHN97191.1 uncharacterized protein DS421_18g625290 [Arachis hypogaea]QHN97192.1 uncharacterized protein DS421_18g625290 [Arachis hypogaea]
MERQDCVYVLLDFGYICVNILRPVLTSQAELGACYFVSLVFYSYFCYLMFDSYDFLST